ncbi:malonate decarboxylase holo-ACP synthase [Pseudomonas monteilii]|uniref:malonate decarboxylase holo-ACP synthase n=1 Tax=Pseudomonas TaxID=286 RepID=UPI00048D9428|nr:MULTISPECIES: malonate decarboxylase holo-ACP synthase [Pseudomonas]KPM63207.1 phosphoribosyl-dephospho-CoA transferase [Pseudomonas putida]MBA1316649.1 malonate decarboxylase holo-ACP synthase [Pseudomonas monteilii]MCE1017414.1 malonate decarboxylase holo-ACP synthase [Pseudomonas monteilii]MCE1034557.1 malonate decarboxylase holo-ACP synthase [Pseudomonas monteilii]MCE1086419.1 malonate decarboxylase holo-ACP synthase [Pseudomonas monteilii]
MNAPRPHDLLWGMPVSVLPTDAPQWALEVLASGQPVVVRRATCEAGWVAVGLRGHDRAQRLGALMRLTDIQRQQGPEALRVHEQSPWPALQALASVTPVLQARGLAWGPTGGVGYQLATGIEVVHADSDLDLQLRTPRRLARAQARELLDILDCAPCRIDVQLETPAGAVALREWASFAPRVLLKSPYGPRLVSDPWAVMERAA